MGEVGGGGGRWGKGGRGCGGSRPRAKGVRAPQAFPLLRSLMAPALFQMVSGSYVVFLSLVMFARSPIAVFWSKIVAISSPAAA